MASQLCPQVYFNGENGKKYVTRCGTRTTIIALLYMISILRFVAVKVWAVPKGNSCYNCTANQSSVSNARNWSYLTRGIFKSVHFLHENRADKCNEMQGSIRSWFPWGNAKLQNFALTSPLEFLCSTSSQARNVTWVYAEQVKMFLVNGELELKVVK